MKITDGRRRTGHEVIEEKRKPPIDSKYHKEML